MLLDVLEILIRDLSDIITADHHRKVLRNTWDDLIKLSLVLYYGLLDARAVLELLAPARVTGGGYDGEGIGFWGCAADVLAD